MYRFAKIFLVLMETFDIQVGKMIPLKNLAKILT